MVERKYENQTEPQCRQSLPFGVGMFVALNQHELSPFLLRLGRTALKKARSKMRLQNPER